MSGLIVLARWSAIAGGGFLTVLALLTCVGLFGRNFVGWSLAGDFELTGVTAGAAIALFMPWCQVKKGHIIVDFFTNRTSPVTQGRLDRLGAVLMALIMALMAWRTAMGGWSAWNTGSGSQILGFPDWLVYAFIAPPLALTSAIAAVQSIQLMPTEDQV